MVQPRTNPCFDQQVIHIQSDITNKLHILISILLRFSDLIVIKSGK